jgi:hypothetical protein
MNREARRLEKEIKEVLEEMSSDEEAKVLYLNQINPFPPPPTGGAGICLCDI